MTSVACLQLFLLIFYLHTYSCYCYLVVYLSCYLVILCLRFILLLFCAHCLYARAVLFTHTHQVAFWRPWICTSRYWMLCFIVQVFDETVRFARSWILSPFLFWYSNLSHLSIISLVSIYRFQLLFQFLILMISCVDVYMRYCSDYWLIIVWIYSLFRLP